MQRVLMFLLSSVAWLLLLLLLVCVLAGAVRWPELREPKH